VAERRRAVAFAVLAAISVSVAAASIAAGIGRADRGQTGGAQQGAQASIPDGGAFVFLDSRDGVYRTVAWTALDAADGEVHPSTLECQRVYFAAGLGLCAGTSQTGSGLRIFDRALRVTHKLDLAGIASRARISGDGRYGATTYFVNGDSYSDVGFSTRTTIVSMATGAIVGELEDFATFRDGARIRSIDFNFWGVTFAQDSNHFYATLGTRGETYLVAGDIGAREMRVLRNNVECPALSPDGRRIAFKKRMPSASPLTVTWQIHVLDLATMAETPVLETRSVDDQVEWLDADRIVYFLPDAGPPTTLRPDLWTLDLRAGAPTRLRTGALSATVVR
jgi:hypothetical protein